jgi:uncharacterized membrane protein YfcA
LPIFEKTSFVDYSTVFILIGIGLLAGMLSGFVGIGGGVVIVPALLYFLGMTQLQAQGTSIAIMLPPVGIMAFYNYYKAGNINLTYAAIIAATFIIGGYFGSKFALKMNPNVVRFVFGLFMLYVAIRLVWTSTNKLFLNGQ